MTRFFGCPAGPDRRGSGRRHRDRAGAARLYPARGHPRPRRAHRPTLTGRPGRTLGLTGRSPQQRPNPRRGPTFTRLPPGQAFGQVGPMHSRKPHPVQTHSGSPSLIYGDPGWRPRNPRAPHEAMKAPWSRPGRLPWSSALSLDHLTNFIGGSRLMEGASREDALDGPSLVRGCGAGVQVRGTKSTDSTMSVSCSSAVFSAPAHAVAWKTMVSSSTSTIQIRSTWPGSWRYRPPPGVLSQTS